jgi:ectoine hydroxylase-related dioxygenase (phytanoyl-CoA dioxygenase family)
LGHHSFDLEQDGLQRFPQLLSDDHLRAIEEIVGGKAASAGVRIFGNPYLESWFSDGPILREVQSVIGSQARPVRAILFDKTPGANWALGWHQDRTIAIRRHLEVTGFEHWTTKGGVSHVEPPFEVIGSMVTARIHLDPVTQSNSPLLVAPGSHLFGRISEADISARVQQCGVLGCLADRGDVWLYRTSILHASEKSESAAHRRVLQVDFSSEELPDGMDWFGIA